MLSKEEIEKYKKHPRVLEVRFIVLYNLFELEYGIQQTMKFYQTICDTFNCNFKLINALINRKYDIQGNSKRKWRFWRQEVMFIAYLYGKSTYKVARNYLHVRPETLYTQKSLYNVECFLNEKWLEEFDNQITLCGEYAYKTELARFMEVMENLNLVLREWSDE